MPLYMVRHGILTIGLTIGLTIDHSDTWEHALATRDRDQSWRPSAFAMTYMSGVKKRGTVLDVACGGGRHFSMFISSGRKIVGVDKDLSEAQRRYAATPAYQLELVQADLEDGRPFPFRGRAFDGVLVTNYLWRPILPDIVACVARDGVLVYETFAVGQEHYGRPSNPDFLLRPEELLLAVQGRLHVIAYEHGMERRPDRVIQRICAVGPDHKWLKQPPLSADA